MSSVDTVARPTDLIDSDEAAVFIADESGHPYDVDLILDDRSMYRRCYRLAEKRMPQTPALRQRLLDAKASLDRRHRL